MTISSHVPETHIKFHNFSTSLPRYASQISKRACIQQHVAARQSVPYWPHSTDNPSAANLSSGGQERAREKANKSLPKWLTSTALGVRYSLYSWSCQVNSGPRWIAHNHCCSGAGPKVIEPLDSGPKNVSGIRSVGPAPYPHGRLYANTGCEKGMDTGYI